MLRCREGSGDWRVKRGIVWSGETSGVIQCACRLAPPKPRVFDPWPAGQIHSPVPCHPASGAPPWLANLAGESGGAWHCSPAAQFLPRTLCTGSDTWSHVVARATRAQSWHAGLGEGGAEPQGPIPVHRGGRGHCGVPGPDPNMWGSAEALKGLILACRAQSSPAPLIWSMGQKLEYHSPKPSQADAYPAAP